MNFLGKIKRSWWIIISPLIFINGFGFIYIGTKYNNQNWILEGVLYELPWFLYLIIYAVFGPPVFLNESFVMILIGLMLYFIGIIRSIWLAFKLVDVYENEEKYTVKTTVINNPNAPRDNDSSSGIVACCLCIVVIFIFFAIFII